MLSAPRSNESRKRSRRRRGFGDVEDRSPEEIFREGVASVLHLLRSQQIDQDFANSLLSVMLSGYVDNAIDRELGDSIAHLVTSAFAQYEREING